MRIAVTGATGFVGSHVAAQLEADGHDVVALTRRPESYDGPGRAVRADVDDPASLAAALDGADAAYYLVHSLAEADFAERDRRGATSFARAADAGGVRHVVYLGGLGDDHDDLSPHLRSRREVERILLAEAPTTAVRAAIVVGEGSISWEILCQLVERLPAMVTPRWVDRHCQPVAIDDATAYLIGVLDLGDEVVGRAFEVGCHEVLTYREMLEIVAEMTARHRLIVPVPVLSPRLSSHWLRLITDVDLPTARSLVDSLTNDVVVGDRRLEELLDRPPLGFRAAAELALAERIRAAGSRRDAS
jgi:uncharacterized protein YbjT (DUF2867 family)